jgi:hypothetical protein
MIGEILILGRDIRIRGVIFAMRGMGGTSQPTADINA